MSRTSKEIKTESVPTVRCAIYTRKSSEEGLALEFNSLDAQRESAEAYIASQKAEGWVALPDRYDDGGFTGGNMERPGLDRLLTDINAGKIDCVIVYKVDRLSRSLMDFARIMSVFDSHKVTFVSVTQHFNTTHSMGRLTLNILLSFAQFEREIIGERIRDKIAAQRRKGKWAGGVPVLGYDVDRSGPSPHLVINAEEAAHVRQIFNMYLERGALLPTVQELRFRGWCNKKRTTARGKVSGGNFFDKGSLYTLLTNPVYIGKTIHKKDIFEGEHPAIVTPEIFKKVADLLQFNRRTGNPTIRNRYGALLRGLLYCKSCDRVMVHTFAGKRGKKGQLYRYYTCCNAIKNGRDQCAAGSIPAGEIERVVVDQVRNLTRDPELLAEVVAEAQRETDQQLNSLQVERGDIEREAKRHTQELKKLTLAPSPNSGTTARIVDLHESLQRGERRVITIAEKITELKSERIETQDIVAALGDFEAFWTRLSPKEQARILMLLLSRVDYDANAGTITTHFHATGIKSLVGEEKKDAA